MFGAELPDNPLPWVITTYVDVNQVRRDAFDEVIAYLEDETKKLVDTMHRPTTEADEHAMAKCWHLRCHIDAVRKMKETHV